jgi:predicted nucleic acid-binding protein
MDVCCWNRSFDFLSHDEIYLEAVAVWKILSLCKDDWVIVSSDIIDLELSKITRKIKLQRIMRIYRSAKRHLNLTPQIEQRAEELHRCGIDWYDSLHLSTAEINRCDVFLTTDKILLRAAAKIPLAITVFNPVRWYFGVYDVFDLPFDKKTGDKLGDFL